MTTDNKVYIYILMSIADIPSMVSSLRVARAWGDLLIACNAGLLMSLENRPESYGSDHQMYQMYSFPKQN